MSSTLHSTTTTTVTRTVQQAATTTAPPTYTPPLSPLPISYRSPTMQHPIHPLRRRRRPPTTFLCATDPSLPSIEATRFRSALRLSRSTLTLPDLLNNICPSNAQTLFTWQVLPRLPRVAHHRHVRQEVWARHCPGSPTAHPFPPRPQIPHVPMHLRPARLRPLAQSSAKRTTHTRTHTHILTTTTTTTLLIITILPATTSTHAHIAIITLDASITGATGGSVPRHRFPCRLKKKWPRRGQRRIKMSRREA